MDFLLQFNAALQLLIVAAMIVGSSVVVTLTFTTIWPTLKQKNITLIYAFSAGFILPLAIMGLAGGGIGHLEEYFGENKSTLDYVIMATIVISSGILGALLYLGIRGLIIRSAKSIHQDHGKHGHADELINISDMDSPRAKWTAVWLILLHRIPAGLMLGMLIWGLNTGSDEVIGAGVIIAFIIHVIPESLVVYYRQIDMGNKRWKSLVFALTAKLFLVPFMFIAYYLADSIESAYWIMPLTLIAGGVIMTINAIIELLPGIIHDKLDSKRWYILFTLIATGIILSITVLIFHHH